jgi:hypothetical protein
VVAGVPKFRLVQQLHGQAWSHERREMGKERKEDKK